MGIGNHIARVLSFSLVSSTAYFVSNDEKEVDIKIDSKIIDAEIVDAKRK